MSIFFHFFFLSLKKRPNKKKTLSPTPTHPARRVVERLAVKVPQVVAHRVGRRRVEQRPRVARAVVPPAHAEERRRGGLLRGDRLVLAVLCGPAADAVLVPVELLACLCVFVRGKRGLKAEREERVRERERGWEKKRTRRRSRAFYFSQQFSSPLLKIRSLTSTPKNPASKANCHVADSRSFTLKSAFGKDA